MAAPQKPRPLRLRFHAVSIASGPGGCALAKSLNGVRLLSLEAPRLPLVGCANPDSCSCKYEHHADRRAGPRRAGMHAPRIGIAAAGFEENRRRLRGRRDADYADE
jgi:hypothetical protein